MVSPKISRERLAVLLKNDFRKTIDITTVWNCNFCGDDWFEVLRRRVVAQYAKTEKRDTLPKRIRKVMHFYYSLNSNHYCSKSCFYNARSHELTHVPKKLYIKESFYCQFCGQFSNGGRWQYIPRLDENLRMCRKCVRRLTMKKAIKAWEQLHRDSRNVYHRNWNHNNTDKTKTYKKRYRETLKTKPPVDYAY